MRSRPAVQTMMTQAAFGSRGKDHGRAMTRLLCGMSSVELIFTIVYSAVRPVDWWRHAQFRQAAPPDCCQSTTAPIRALPAAI